MSNPSEMDKRRDLAPIVGLIILIAFILGYLYPDQWWGTHFLAFMPKVWMGIFLGVAGGLIASPLFLPQGLSLKINWPGPKSYWGLSIVLPLAFTGLCFLFPIADDNYGDADRYLEFINERVSAWPSNAVESLFSLDFSPGQGRRAALGLVALFAYSFDLTFLQAFSFLGVLCYFGYLLIWMRFVPVYFQSASSRSLMLLMGVTAPLIQVFMGHAETYSLVFLLLTGWLLLMLLAYKTQRKNYFWILLGITLVGLRFHGFFLLLLPGLALTGLYLFKPNLPTTQSLLRQKGMLLFVLLPLLAIGATLYFIVLQDHNDPRHLNDILTGERLFLPLNTPDPPLDRYNLLSGYHIFDFLNVIFLWSPPAFLVLGILLRAFRRKIDWNQPALVVMVLTLLLVVLMLFMTNPLMSMPMDWDLYCFAGPVLLAFVAVLLAQLEAERIASRIFLPALGLALMTFPMLWVNASTTAHSQRLESVAVHVFRTYYLHSDRYLLYAQQLTSPDAEAYLERQSRYLVELKPDARFQNDPKYHLLLIDRALTLDNTQDSPEEVRNTFLEAELYDALAPDFLLTLLEKHFELGDFAQANFRAGQLIEVGYPNPGQALRIGIHTALEAEDYPAASERCKAYLALNPQDVFIQGVSDSLATGEALDQLKLLFSRGPKE